MILSEWEVGFILILVGLLLFAIYSQGLECGQLRGEYLGAYRVCQLTNEKIVVPYNCSEFAYSEVHTKYDCRDSGYSLLTASRQAAETLVEP